MYNRKELDSTFSIISTTDCNSFFILYLYIREGYNAFNDFNLLEKEVEETWEIKVARRIRLNPQNRKNQKKTQKRRIRDDPVSFIILVKLRLRGPDKSGSTFHFDRQEIEDSNLR